MENKQPTQEKQTEKPTQEKAVEKIIKDAKPVEVKSEVKETKETKKAKVEDKVISSESKASEKHKKTEAVVNATSLPISTKHSIAICNMIRNMTIDQSLAKLDLAEKMKIPVPMRGEIPHKKGIMSGRYPVNALGHFIKVLKSLKSNAMVNELELEKYKLFCKANLATRPYRRFGKGRFKRTHLQVKLVPITLDKKKNESFQKRFMSKTQK